MCYSCELRAPIISEESLYHPSTQSPSICSDQGRADNDRVLVRPKPGVFDAECREIVPSDSVDGKTLGFSNLPIISIKDFTCDEF